MVYLTYHNHSFSTETALLKVHNDVTLNMGKGKVTVLTLLDLSAAFDTIDHSNLIKCLSLWYGVSVFVVWCICLCGMEHLSLWYVVSGTALCWFSSYLTDRQRRVKIADCLSTSLPTSCGVPQGSVLGPFLFTLFTTPLSSVIQSHSLVHHLYAVDT